MNLREFKGVKPTVHPTAYVDPMALIVGNVHVDEMANIWPFAVLRGDLNEIRVGKYTSVQDNVVVHVDADSPASIGNYIRIGHSAVLHGCTVRDYALIGIGAIVYNGVEVGEGAVVGMGAVVAPGTKVPPASVMLGIPAKPARKVTDEEKKEFLDGTIRYAQLGQAHRVALISQET